MELVELTSWALVGLAGTSHCAARAEFASRYDKFVRRVLAKRWLGSPYRIYFDDAIQEVFVECFKSGGVIAKANPEQGATFRTLLFRVTTHVAARFERNHFRDSQTVSVDDANLESLHDDESAFAQITREEVAVVVREVLRRLTNHSDLAVRERAQLLVSHTCDEEKIIHIAHGDRHVAEGLHREHSKAKKEFQSTFYDVVQSLYQTHPDEIQPIVRELLGVCE